MTHYLVMAYMLLFPVIIAGGIFLTQYMRIRMFSANSFVFDVVSARRLGYYALKFVGVLSQVVGFAYLLKVFFAKVIGIGFSYPMLIDSSIEISDLTFLYFETVLGLVLMVVGAVLVFVASRRLRKLDSRKNTYLDRIYSLFSKMMLVYLAIFPMFFAVQETVVYFVNEKFPAVDSAAVSGQGVNIFQVIDYVSTGGATTTTTTFVSVSGMKSPGGSLGLAVSFFFALTLMKIGTRRSMKVAVPMKSTKATTASVEEEVVSTKKTSKKTSSSKKK